MNKTEFLRLVSINSNVNKSCCQKVLNSCYFVLCSCLQKGDCVNLYGFGKFYVKSYKERFVNNKLGLIKLVPAKNIPCFKIGSNFKQIIK